MEQTGTQGPPPMAPGPSPQSQPPGGKPRHHYRYRSLFWPMVLIGAGVVWLLYSLDVVSTSNLAVLGLVWPVFVIGIGVGPPRGPPVSDLASAAVGVVTVGIVVVSLAVGPSLGWVGSTELTTETFSTPVGEATQAQIEMGLSGYTTSIHALPDGCRSDTAFVVGHAHAPGHRGLQRRRDHQQDGDPRVGQRLAVVAEDRQRHRDPLGHRARCRAAPRHRRARFLGFEHRGPDGALQLRTLEVHASSGDSQIVLPDGPMSASRLPEVSTRRAVRGGWRSRRPTAPPSP